MSKNTSGQKRLLIELGRGLLYLGGQFRVFCAGSAPAGGMAGGRASGGKLKFSGRSLVGIAVFLLGMVLQGPQVEAGESNRYKVGLGLSDSAAGAVTALHFSFGAITDAYEELERVEIDFPAGSKLNAKALVEKCRLEKEGTDAGAVCEVKYPQAKIGSGVLVTSVLGLHTIRATVYLVEPTDAPSGENLLYYFPAGQIFGASAQTLFGRLSPGPQGTPVMRLQNIQGQLSLPFGMSADLVDGTFEFAGQGGQAPFINPSQGQLSSWQYGVRLGWDDELETTSLAATALKATGKP